MNSSEPRNQEAVANAAVPGPTGSKAVLITATLGFLVPFLLNGAGLFQPHLYDKGVLFLFYKVFLPATPYIWAVAAVALVFFLEKDSPRLLAMIAAVLGFSLGVFVLEDWWYYLPLTLAFGLPFFLWYGRRRFWNSDVTATVVVFAFAVLLLIAAAFSGIQFDERFGLRLGPLSQRAVATGLIFAVVVLLSGWALFFGLSQRRKRRALIADLIERSPRLEGWFNEVLATTKPTSSEKNLERLQPCIPQRDVSGAGALWPPEVVAPLPRGSHLAQDVPAGILQIPGIRPLAILFRPHLTPGRINSEFFLASLRQAVECDLNSFWKYAFEYTPTKAAPDFRDERVVKLRLIRGDGPDEISVDEKIVLGTDPELAFTLPQTEEPIDASHCTISIVHDGILVEDHSDKGTIVNGVDVLDNSCVAHNGHFLVIGDLEYEVSDKIERIDTTGGADESHLAELARQSESERDANRRKADAHFARYVLLSEALAEASCYFGVTVRNPKFDILDPICGIEFWRDRIENLINIVEGNQEPTEFAHPELSSSADWAGALEIYENLWLQNLYRLFVTRGRRMPETLDSSAEDLPPDPVDFRRLTGSLVLLRAQASPHLVHEDQAAADLSLFLWLIRDEQLATRAGDALSSYVDREIESAMSGGNDAITDEGWESIALAALPFLIWAISTGKATIGEKTYNVFSLGHAHVWGSVGSAFSMALGTLTQVERVSDWEVSATRSQVQNWIEGSAAAFDEIEPPEIARRLKLAFLVHALRDIPEDSGSD